MELSHLSWEAGHIGNPYDSIHTLTVEADEVAIRGRLGCGSIDKIDSKIKNYFLPVNAFSLNTISLVCTFQKYTCPSSDPDIIY